MRLKASFLASAITLGLIGGLVFAVAWPPYVYRVTSGYSHRSFLLTFRDQPSEETLLDAVIYHEPLIQQKFDTTQGWRRAKAEGSRLLIKVDDSHSILVSPYSREEDPNISFSGGTKIIGVWLTQPSTRVHFPVAVLRVGYFAAGFVAAAIAAMLLGWIWYFLLARIRELSHAVRGHDDAAR